MNDLPNIALEYLAPIDPKPLIAKGDDGHPPRILLLYGSLRDSSYSRMAAEEAARVLQYLGCETRFFDPSGLPLPDDAPATHPKVEELRELA
ncbi:MAG: NAD(P)H-dependent oxidoreductase, partial [Pseudomonadota bacterium]